MYEFLEGEVVRRSAARVVLDVGGVGYDLLVPLGSTLPAVGAKARLWVHLVVREDAHTLYGFPDRDTRELFRTLLRVRGVGPAMALAMLSGLTRQELVEAIMNEDVSRLTTVKGVGKKTAEQILLDLRDRMSALTAGLELAPGVLQPAAPPSADAANIEDALSALMALGFSDKDARKRVEKAAKEVGAEDLNRLVQTAFHA